LEKRKELRAAPGQPHWSPGFGGVLNADAVELAMPMLERVWQVIGGLGVAPMTDWGLPSITDAQK
jgi:hypothetical protein